MTTPLHGVLVDKIRSRGPMPFAAFMQLALYHPHHGYYASGETRTGWSGHFVTSPELDPGFGALWARAFQQIWEMTGSPREFHLIEVGPGESGFAASVLDSVEGPFADALHLDLIERSPAVEKRQRSRLATADRVSWHRSITEVDAVEVGCLFANEVLDNLPVHLVQRSSGEVQEICVAETDGTLHEVAMPASNPELENFVTRCGVELPEGNRFEVHLAADSLLKRAASIIGRGAAIFVDYGSDAHDLAQRPEGSLVCYSGSGADDRPLAEPGTKDITVHANWSGVRTALERADCAVAGPTKQRSVLKELGLDRLHDELRDEFQRRTAEGEGAAALRAVSRRQALGALADPAGLGGLDVLAGLRGIETPPFLQSGRERAGP